MKKTTLKQKRQQDVERQRTYQTRLKSEGKSQFKITLNAVATSQLNSLMKKTPDKSKSQVMETLIALAYAVTQKAEQDPAWLESLELKEGDSPS